MKFIILFLLIFLFDSSSFLYSQTNSKLLKIGDQIPHVKFINVLNFSKNTIELSELKGKLVLLDFWNMGCAPCIKSFPKLEAIQNEFKDKLQILLVNVNDTKEYLQSIGFPRNVKSPIIRQTKLPFVKDMVGVSLDSLFEMGTLPYHVWIDENGKLLATTAGNSTTSERIEEYFKIGKLQARIQPNLPDVGLAWGDYSNQFKSILQPESKIVFGNMLYSSIITRNLDVKGFSSTIQDSTSGKIIGIRISGDPLHIFRATYSNINLINYPDRVVLEVNNPGDFIMPPVRKVNDRANWEENNIYSYELKLPPNKLSDGYRSVQKIMRQDFERFFGVSVTVEVRMVKCRILVRSSNDDRISTKGGPEQIIIRNAEDGGGIILTNAKYSRLPNTLQRYFMHNPSIMPFRDETGLDPALRIDIDISNHLDDVDQVKKALIRFGLSIIEEERELEVLVVKKLH